MTVVSYVVTDDKPDTLTISGDIDISEGEKMGDTVTRRVLRFSWATPFVPSVTSTPLTPCLFDDGRVSVTSDNRPVG